jgi:hypothetical protein
MNDEALNLSIRTFLKQFGVSAQREIEQAVRAALRDGTLRGDESFPATATLRVGKLALEFTTDGQIELA